MSGGHWDYRQYLVRSFVDEVFEDEDAKKDFLPETLELIKELGFLLEEVIHDMDWHLSGDTLVENPEEFHQQFKTKLSAITLMGPKRDK